MAALTSLIAGLLFGIGLLISGMTNPAKVQNFLDLFGQWDPSLVFVMVGAIAITAPGYYLLRKRSTPLFVQSFQWPNTTDLDRRLIAGATLFGVGWGLGGFCPGPAIAALPNVFENSSGALWFTPAMLIGLMAAKHYRKAL